MIDAIDLTACLASAGVGAAAAGFLAMGQGLRMGWRRGRSDGWDEGFDNALDASAMAKSLKDRKYVVSDPSPSVAGQGSSPAAEVCSVNHVADANVKSVEPDVTASVLHLHNVIPIAPRSPR